jgi:SagB-type dehydrogenase family enzyme
MKDIGKEFMLKTQYRFLDTSEQELNLPQPPLELPIPPEAKRIALPKADSLERAPIDLLALIERRRSIRNYGSQPLALAELAFLLWCTQGVKRVTSRPVTMRTVPSAGARHAFETYILCNRVEGLAAGLYRYAAIEHALLEVDLSPDVGERLTVACHDQNQVRTSAVTFAWVAVRARMYWRYGERGYRYLHLDAGHVCQNLYLAAEALNCGVCAIAAYDDEQTNAVLGADGVDQFTIYLASLGKKLGRNEI